MKKLLLISFLLVFAGCALAGKKTNLPMSKEASLVEAYSSSELTIKATGIGRNEKAAIADIYRSAVHFVLYGGTDPLLSTAEAQLKFSRIEEDFFAPSNLTKYISWESDKFTTSMKIRMANKKKGRKMTKMVRVNTKVLTDDLVARNIIIAKDVIAEEIGLPFIMVIPDVPTGQTPLQVFDANNLAKHSAAVIESYLTAKKYDVVVPRASEQLNDLSKIQSELKGAEEDVSYQLALSLGADVYIVYSGEVKNSKASVVVKAYETTTARLLGTETGYSKKRPGTSKEALVEEAINGAITNVLKRVNSYWMDDMKKGLQYKLIFKIMGDFDEDQTEEIQEEISDLIDDDFDRSKENIIADKTMDYLVWAKKDDFKKASKIYRFFKSELDDVKVRKININRKMLILGIYEED